MPIRFKKVNKPFGKLQWETGSYNTYYFDNQQEFEENKNKLSSLNQNYSTWTDNFGRFCLQILQ